MADKSLSELIDNFNAAKQAENLLSTEITGINAKITQLNNELDAMEVKRAKLETAQTESLDLVVAWLMKLPGLPGVKSKTLWRSCQPLATIR
jgi:predicted  nucleic acid-binding Zn-ribbon protein